MARFRRVLGLSGAPLLAVALLLAVYLLPPDTSLAEVKRLGRIGACVPESLPPLVTGDPARPGIEVELLRAIAAELGVGLTLNVVPAMGQGFNPRNWHITRAQCEIVGGGLLDTAQTRGYLAPGPAYGVSGWTAIWPGEPGTLSGATVGVLARAQGGDRVALSAYLRREGARVQLVPGAADLAEGLAAGRLAAGIAEAMQAAPIAEGREGWQLAPLPPPLSGQRLILGLWKGDLTLKRAVEAAFAHIEGDGRLAEILGRYAAG